MNNTKNLVTLLIVFFFGFLSVPCHGQPDSIRKIKNTIYFNLSNSLIFDLKYNVVGYERVLSDHQSVSISIGSVSLPKWNYLADTLSLKDQNSGKGFHASLEYRFYPARVNKYSAPQGIFFGPYYSFNSFSRNLVWDMNTADKNGNVNLGFNLKANFIGCQLGYQFVFWKRLAIDMVLMGPGFWNFKLKSHFDSDLSLVDETLLLERLNVLLKEKLPYSNLVVKGSDFELRRSTSANVMGFRYLVNIGFRF